jgi:hypothetical protein
MEETLQTVYAQHLIRHLLRPFELVSLHGTDDLEGCFVEYSVFIGILSFNDRPEASDYDGCDFVDKEIDVFELR